MAHRLLELEDDARFDRDLASQLGRKRVGPVDGELVLGLEAEDALAPALEREVLRLAEMNPSIKEPRGDGRVEHDARLDPVVMLEVGERELQVVPDDCHLGKNVAQRAELLLEQVEDVRLAVWQGEGEQSRPIAEEIGARRTNGQANPAGMEDGSRQSALPRLPS